MINIMLVDDEVLALEYLKNMADWEAHGYHIAGCAANSRRALELYDQTPSEIVISDIRMPVMDGLELTRRLKEKNPDVEIILLSAYGDFAYAKKGIEYGVSDYILKHEISGELLLEKLDAARTKINKKSRREKVYQKYFMEQLIYHPSKTDEAPKEMFSNRLFLVLCHRRGAFCGGEQTDEAWSAKERETLMEAMEKSLEDKIFYVTDVWLAKNNWLVLYRIEHAASKYEVNTLIENKCAQMGEKLKTIRGCHFDILYSFEILAREISGTFQKMSNQIRYYIFSPENKWHSLQEILPKERENLWEGAEIGRLNDEIYKTDGNPSSLVKEVFLKIKSLKNLGAYKSLVILFNDLLWTIWEREHLEGTGRKEKRYTIEEIEAYYEENFQRAHELVCKESAYSGLTQEVIRYIRKNYENEISLETLGQAFQMNGVYLGQIFRKETGTTFLKYLTEVRMKEAKRLLKEENISVLEVAERVGYSTSQYFCKVFGKATGMTPWEYRRWKEKN